MSYTLKKLTADFEKTKNVMVGAGHYGSVVKDI